MLRRALPKEYIEYIEQTLSEGIEKFHLGESIDAFKILNPLAAGLARFPADVYAVSAHLRELRANCSQQLIDLAPKIGTEFYKMGIELTEAELFPEAKEQLDKAEGCFDNLLKAIEFLPQQKLPENFQTTIQLQRLDVLRAKKKLAIASKPKPIVKARRIGYFQEEEYIFEQQPNQGEDSLGRKGSCAYIALGTTRENFSDFFMQLNDSQLQKISARLKAQITNDYYINKKINIDFKYRDELYELLESAEFAQNQRSSVLQQLREQFHEDAKGELNAEELRPIIINKIGKDSKEEAELAEAELNVTLANIYLDDCLSKRAILINYIAHQIKDEWASTTILLAWAEVSERTLLIWNHAKDSELLYLANHSYHYNSKDTNPIHLIHTNDSTHFERLIRMNQLEVKESYSESKLFDNLKLLLTTMMDHKAMLLFPFKKGEKDEVHGFELWLTREGGLKFENDINAFSPKLKSTLDRLDAFNEYCMALTGDVEQNIKGLAQNDTYLLEKFFQKYPEIYTILSETLLNGKSCIRMMINEYSENSVGEYKGALAMHGLYRRITSGIPESTNTTVNHHVRYQ